MSDEKTDQCTDPVPFAGTKLLLTELRTSAKNLGVLVISLKDDINPHTGSPPGVDKGEAVANVMLAYRHLEDARMRLGKVIQALDGGTSVYDEKAFGKPYGQPAHGDDPIPFDDLDSLPGKSEESSEPQTGAFTPSAPSPTEGDTADSEPGYAPLNVTSEFVKEQEKIKEFRDARFSQINGSGSSSTAGQN